MLQKSRRRSRSRAAAEGLLTQVNKYIPVAAFFSTFLTVQDINSQSSAQAKLENFVNQLTGKLTGVNFFNSVPQYAPSISVSGLNNPVSRAGAVLTIAGIVGQKFKLPYMGRVKSVGVKIAIPSAIGGMIGGTGSTTASAAGIAQPQSATQPGQTVV